MLRTAVHVYFELSHRLLATRAGRAFSELAVNADEPQAHGYTTASDIDALEQALRPKPSDVLLDVGCGFGEIAIALHRRTGCRVTGIDVADSAIREARRRGARAGVEDFVGFEVADPTGRVPPASSAYAIDSLMFVRDPWTTLASLSRRLDPPGRVFVTYVDGRYLSDEQVRRRLERSGLKVESFEDVTHAFADRSRRRSDAAARVLRSEGLGGLGLLLFLAEEAVVRFLVRHGTLRRWRFSVLPADHRSGNDPTT